ncbi:hypothetical protein [Halobacteriovorax sp. CON-3]|uniref:hypothetical protein n=1 Tax=Halobacteriovorax sp. CON-3 TaxID=3157710 RepID=UPI0037142096
MTNETERLSTFEITRVLADISVFTDGFFPTSIFYSGPSSRYAVRDYFKKHPEYVSEILRARIRVLQITDSFNAKNGIIAKRDDNITKTRVLSGIISSAFIRLNGPPKTGSLHYGKTAFFQTVGNVIADPFDDVLIPEHVEVIATISDRIKHFSELGYSAIVPPALSSKHTKSLCTEMYNDIMNYVSSGKVLSNTLESKRTLGYGRYKLITNYENLNLDSVHTEKLSYPGIEKKLTGTEKIELDKQLGDVPSEDINKDYVFGVYVLSEED